MLKRYACDTTCPCVLAGAPAQAILYNIYSGNSERVNGGTKLLDYEIMAASASINGKYLVLLKLTL